MAWIPIKNPTVEFDECPFCHSGETMLLANDKTPGVLMIVHYPPKGVNCPARYEQVCDAQEIAAKWWNDRSKKN